MKKLFKIWYDYFFNPSEKAEKDQGTIIAKLNAFIFIIPILIFGFIIIGIASSIDNNGRKWFSRIRSSYHPHEFVMKVDDNVNSDLIKIEWFNDATEPEIVYHKNKAISKYFKPVGENYFNIYYDSKLLGTIRYYNSSLWKSKKFEFSFIQKSNNHLVEFQLLIDGGTNYKVKGKDYFY